MSDKAELTVDEKLVVLMEECAEVIKAASKCLRFGYDRTQPDYGKNDEALAAEIGDVLGMVDSLPLDWELVARHRVGKLSRAEKAKAKFGKRKEAGA